MKYLDDIQIGAQVELGRHTFTAQEIKTFAERFDPQAFHVDEEAGRRSIYGSLIASGWHTAAMVMRMGCDAYLLDSTSVGSPTSARALAKVW